MISAESVNDSLVFDESELANATPNGLGPISGWDGREPSIRLQETAARADQQAIDQRSREPFSGDGYLSVSARIFSKSIPK